MQVTNRSSNSHPYPVANPSGYRRGEAGHRQDQRAVQGRPRISRRSSSSRCWTSCARPFTSKTTCSGSGMGQDIYNDMLYNEYAKKMASTAQFGLADMIYKQVSSK